MFINNIFIPLENMPKNGIKHTNKLFDAEKAKLRCMHVDTKCLFIKNDWN